MTIVLAVLAVATFTQTPAPSPKRNEPKAAPAAPPRGSLALTVKGGILGTVDIQARQVEAKAILERLKAELKIPLVASTLVAGQRVDLSMKGTTVIALLTALAPVVLADLEVAANPDDAQWKAIHLIGYNEKEPERELKPAGILIAAGTINEDGTVTLPDPDAADKIAAKGLEEEPQDADKPRLAVVVSDGRVSLKSRRQQLVTLLHEVATRAQIPFDIRGEVDMVPVDIELKDLPLRDLPVALGRTGVRLVIRRNLSTGEEFVQGILAGEPRPLTTTPRD